jgi:hypothetical protein
MKPYMTKILDSNALGATSLALLSAAWVPSTSATYGSTIRRYSDLCEEHRLAALVATPAHMARYVAILVEGVVLVVGVLGRVGVATCAHKDVPLPASCRYEAVSNVLCNVLV